MAISSLTPAYPKLFLDELEARLETTPVYFSIPEGADVAVDESTDSTTVENTNVSPQKKFCILHNGSEEANFCFIAKGLKCVVHVCSCNNVGDSFFLSQDSPTQPDSTVIDETISGNNSPKQEITYKLRWVDNPKDVKHGLPTITENWQKHIEIIDSTVVTH